MRTKVTAAAHIAENILGKLEKASIPHFEFLFVTAGVAEFHPNERAVDCLARAEKSRAQFARATQ